MKKGMAICFQSNLTIKSILVLVSKLKFQVPINPQRDIFQDKKIMHLDGDEKLVRQHSAFVHSFKLYNTSNGTTQHSS